MKRGEAFLGAGLLAGVFHSGHTILHHFYESGAASRLMAGRTDRLLMDTINTPPLIDCLAVDQLDLRVPPLGSQQAYLSHTARG